MLRLLRALWRASRAKVAPPATLQDLTQRVTSLEGDLEHLVKEHVKLRGRVTGGVRRPKVEADSEYPEGGSREGAGPSGGNGETRTNARPVTLTERPQLFLTRKLRAF